ncbi:uncharacterized protein VTP21DRAFT_1664 [Calcarisporiella thermophila]|uniref:uncharacterized protein n=1 Tax=Calcarisporiella thermophila TaxID=911321 RepID=UPI003744827D
MLCLEQTLSAMSQEQLQNSVPSTPTSDVEIRLAQLSTEDHEYSNGAESVESGEDALTLRALVSTREAGVIIGKGGQNVAHLRESTGVKAGVSKMVQGVNDRVLTVQGPLEGVSKAYGLIAQSLVENPAHSGSLGSPPPTNLAIRLLISHNLMGTIIGRQGAKIKHIQDSSGARMTASKEMLPQSTERVVEVHGTVDAIRLAVLETGRCLLEDKERGVGTVLYNPSVRLTLSEFDPLHPLSRRESLPVSMRRDSLGIRRDSAGGGAIGGMGRRESVPVGGTRTQSISIPPDMVGCIIGKGGSRISEIRRMSGSRISIAREAHDETGERMFTIQGTPESNEKALLLLYSQLEMEKERRLSLSGGHE